MQHRLHLLMFLCVFSSSVLLAPLVVNAQVVALPEDELVLPPLLRHYAGGNVLNVTSLKNAKRAVKEGEWLEYGDFFSLLDRMSLQVIMRENLQWVGGGVFQGRIGQRTWNKEHSPYEIFLERGWMKVWAKPNERKHAIKIFTKNVDLTTDSAVFWLTTRPGRTEVYLISGELQDSSGHKFNEKKFYLWEGEKQQLKSTSQAWNEGAIEVQLAALFPAFIKLADKAQSEWKVGDVEDVYSDLRRKGWRKASRLEPDAKVYPAQKKK